ncbi:hypothetical protein RhiJN_15741 [Ceratobasidium sp. AG-Ba]|nr:hypothetical protein RhiJN_15741 [Ceratobasidium sp. AG-Ba]
MRSIHNEIPYFDLPWVVPGIVAAQANVPVPVIGGIAAPKFSNSFIAVRLRADGFTVAAMALPGFPVPGARRYQRDPGQVIWLLPTWSNLDGIAVQIEAKNSWLQVVSCNLLHTPLSPSDSLSICEWLKYHGGSNKVPQYVSVGSLNHGAENKLPFTNGPLTADIRNPTSPFLIVLKVPRDTFSETRYTLIAVVYDDIISPASEVGLLTGSDGNRVVV